MDGRRGRSVYRGNDARSSGGESRRVDGGTKSEQKRKRPKKQNMQHPAFPRGPPPQYYPGSTLLNFAVRMGSGDPG